MTANSANQSSELSSSQLVDLAKQIKVWGKELGFNHVGISNTDLSQAEHYLQKWIDAGFQGEMDYMHKHGLKRSRPEQLHDGTLSLISVRLDYAPDDIDQSEGVLQQSQTAYISRYALGRDYHKVIRNRLQKLAQKISDAIGEFSYRAFTDSAPVLEKAIAEKAGLGWIGKHSNLIDAKSGSWFFLGELYTDLPLPSDTAATNHCGSCSRCIQECPTDAIVAPYKVDARRCISYLTIELHGSIPHEFRQAIGNRIYGCDDCQLVCPWNKFAEPTHESDFSPREWLKDRPMLELFNWSKNEFLKQTEGSPIRRIGHERWLRNIAIGLGNADYDPKILQDLEAKRAESSKMVQEHIDWAIEQQKAKQAAT